MAYIVQNIDVPKKRSGEYSRADFISALEEKQNLLVSSVNIKTINYKGVLGRGNLVVEPTVYSYDLSVSQRAIVDDVKTLINKYNPDNEFITFGVVTDTHIMPTRNAIQTETDIEEVVEAIQAQGIDLKPVENGTIADNIRSTWPSTDASYYGNTTAEDYIKMIGAVGFEKNLDLIIHNGDISSGRLPYNCYAYIMEKTARLFDKYISVPHFVCEGNHDYKYSDSTPVRENVEWRKYMNRFNNVKDVNMVYVKDIENAQQYAQSKNTDISDYTSFYVDIDKGGLNKLRFASPCVYETGRGSNGNPVPISRYFTLDMSDKDNSEISQWSAINIAHVQFPQFTSNYANAFFNCTTMGAYSSTEYNNFNAPNGGIKPKSYVGAIFGHNHDSVYSRISFTDGSAPQIRVGNAYDGGAASPSFSVFIFDTENWWLYEIQAGNRRRSTSGFTEGVYENTDNLSNAWCFRYKLSHN